MIQRLHGHLFGLFQGDVHQPLRGLPIYENILNPAAVIKNCLDAQIVCSLHLAVLGADPLGQGSLADGATLDQPGALLQVHQSAGELRRHRPNGYIAIKRLYLAGFIELDREAALKLVCDQVA